MYFLSSTDKNKTKCRKKLINIDILRTFNIEMQALANIGQIRSKSVRNVRLSPLYAIVGQYWTNVGQYICATGTRTSANSPLRSSSPALNPNQLVVGRMHKITLVNLTVKTIYQHTNYLFYCSNYFSATVPFMIFV